MLPDATARYLSGTLDPLPPRERPMTRKRLPIGIQDFARLRETDSYYVDKTLLIRDLIAQGDHWFLSRPRRFGKSLLVDTIKALFEGREDLFEGLDIHRHWDWSVAHPVVRLSFDGKCTEPEDIERNILAQLDVIERNAGLSDAACRTAPERLLDLLDRLHRSTGQRAVILVDEYDKPILDALHDPALATANREYLRGFYGIVHDSAEHVRFVFVTGISMFSKVSLFSGLNNLKDISLDPRHATVCGYTDEDIDTVFAPALDGLDRDEHSTWSDGYRWRGETRLYNPYDVLLLLDSREFRPWWFETGSPRFLFETLKKKSVGPMDFEGRLAEQALISRFDVDDIGVEALLFQTGYLTVTEEHRDDFDTLYRLDYPNLEVRLSLNDHLLAHLDGRNRVPLEEGRSLRAASGGARVRGVRGASQGVAVGHSLPVARDGGPCAPRGVACEPAAHVLPCDRGRGAFGGGVEPRARGHGGSPGGRGVRDRVQDGGGRGRCGGGPRGSVRSDAGAGLCRQVSRAARPSGRRRLRARGAEPARSQGRNAGGTMLLTDRQHRRLSATANEAMSRVVSFEMKPDEGIRN